MNEIVNLLRAFVLTVSSSPQSASVCCLRINLRIMGLLLHYRYRAARLSSVLRKKIDGCGSVGLRAVTLLFHYDNRLWRVVIIYIAQSRRGWLIVSHVPLLDQVTADGILEYSVEIKLYRHPKLYYIPRRLSMKLTTFG